MKKIVICLLLLIPLNIKALEFGKNAKSVVLLEPTTGTIIYEKNSHEKLAPASMTKMMSMLLIIENINKGVLNWDDIITVSEHASSMGGSQILLETNERMKVEDLFKGIAIASGNDAVVALAEAIAGSEEGFVEMMNKRAHELGLTDTNFKNSHGLDTANHYSTAYDMAILARELVKYPKVLEFTKIYDTYLRENLSTKIWLVNTNKLVKFYDGVDGLKTGYTNTAGYCLTATAIRNNMRIISVVMGEPDSGIRNNEVKEMLDYAFAQYKLDLLLDTDTIIDEVEIETAKTPNVSIVPIDKVTSFYKKIDEIKERNYTLELNELNLPIKKGEIVGKLIITEGDNERIVDVTVSKDISKANLFELFIRYLNEIFSINMI